MSALHHTIDIDAITEESVEQVIAATHVAGVGSKCLKVVVVPFQEKTTYVVEWGPPGTQKSSKTFTIFRLAVGEYNDILI